MNDLYKRLKRLALVRKEVSISKLAEIAGISKTTMSNLRTGKTENLAERTLDKLAQALDMTVEELLEFNESPAKKEAPAALVPDNFIRLTLTDNGAPLFLRKDTVLSVYGRDMGRVGNSTVIISDDAYDVMESAEEIMELLC